jgi:hypothetical protein
MYVGIVDYKSTESELWCLSGLVGKAEGRTDRSVVVVLSRRVVNKSAPTTVEKHAIDMRTPPILFRSFDVRQVADSQSGQPKGGDVGGIGFQLAQSLVVIAPLYNVTPLLST